MADLPNAQRPGGALVEQRLEHVAGSAIKQRDLDIDTPEPARAEQPSESAPDDQHPCSTVTHHVTLFRIRGPAHHGVSQLARNSAPLCLALRAANAHRWPS